MPKENFQNESLNNKISSFCMDYRDVEKVNGSENFISKSSFNKHHKIPKPKKKEKTEDIFFNSFEKNSEVKIIDETENSQDMYDKYIESKKNELIYNAKPQETHSPKYIYPKEDQTQSSKVYIPKNTQNPKPHKFIAMFLIATLIFGICFFVSNIEKDQIIGTTFEYDSFLLPVVMQDIEPFEDIDQINTEKAIKSAVWSTLINSSDNKYNDYDDNGKIIVPLNDVKQSITKLFGSEYNIEPSNIQNCDLYSYDNQTQTFHIPVLSNRNCFLPHTESIDRNNNTLVLLVSYIAPDDPYRCEEDGSATEPNPYKQMKYTLKLDSNTKSSYISSISEI